MRRTSRRRSSATEDAIVCKRNSTHFQAAKTATQSDFCRRSQIVLPGKMAENFYFPLYGEPYRPQYHFTPPAGFMNDPAGLVYWNGWQLYYQYNPFSMTAGYPNWGHAFSADLLHWQNLPIAIPTASDGQIYTGSAVVDMENTSGFFSGAGLVAIYTLSKPGKEVQEIAYTQNGGVTFAKYEGNPVLDLDYPNCRDPKVFWHAPSGRWVMAVALPQARQVLFYASCDLKEWSFLSRFGPGGIEGCEWECPNLLEISLEDSGEKKWVLLVGINPGAPLGGSINAYFVGNFDGTSFQADDTMIRVMDFGKDYYAVQTFNGAPEGEVIAIGWASNWQYTQAVPTFPWRGAFGIPRVLALRKSGSQANTSLVQRPISLESLRDKTLYEGSALLGIDPLCISLEGNASFEFKATFAMRPDRDEAPTRLSIDILNLAGEKVTVGYDWSTACVYVNRGQALGFSHASFSPYFETTCVDRGNPLELHVLVDHSMLEVFVNDGLHVCTTIFFMQHGPPTEISWRAEHGGANAEDIRVYTLKSVWK
jgi:sucrose-6-phosphate hydrolase SacC (GH32 family)